MVPTNQHRTAEVGWASIISACIVADRPHLPLLQADGGGLEPKTPLWPHADEPCGITLRQCQIVGTTLPTTAEHLPAIEVKEHESAINLTPTGVPDPSPWAKGGAPARLGPQAGAGGSDPPYGSRRKCHAPFHADLTSF